MAIFLSSSLNFNEARQKELDAALAKKKKNVFFLALEELKKRTIIFIMFRELRNSPKSQAPRGFPIQESPRRVEGSRIQPLASGPERFEGSMGLFLKDRMIAFFRRHKNPPPRGPRGAVEQHGAQPEAPWETTGFVIDVDWAEGRRLTPCLAFRDEGDYQVQLVRLDGQGKPPIWPDAQVRHVRWVAARSSPPEWIPAVPRPPVVC